jgi:hypothetical protein
MIFFAPEEIPFDVGEFYTVQTMAGLPPLPHAKSALGQAYNLFATPGAPTLTGSISFQYLGVDALTEGLNEDREQGLKIHFWDGNRWQVPRPYTISTQYNLASASSQGRGMYALLHGVTTPVLTATTPSVATNDLTTTLVITGHHFLPPVQIVLLGSDTYPLSAHIAGSDLITTQVPPDLPAQEYELLVVNGDGGASPAPGTLGLFEPEDACFYDRFESGPNKWERDGDWDIVHLQGLGVRAMTDSPAGAYKNAGDYGGGLITYTTTITSQSFNLTSCTNPTLTFRHDYVLAKLGPSQDVARVEISTDDGATWTELARYSGGGIFGEGQGTQDVESPEWTSVSWKEVEIGLSDYMGGAQSPNGGTRLRFSLEVNDDAVASKGWVIDDILVQSEPEPGPPETDVYLPIILKEE